MEYVDYYAALGVPKTASEAEIRAAYRKLARQHHPDVNPGDTDAEERFKKINEAHEVLSDPAKRTRYDELGSNWQAFAAGAAPGQGRASEYRTVNEDDLRDLFGDQSPFSDFFESMFGGSVYRAAPRRGADVETVVEIDLADAYRGLRRQLSFDLENRPRRLEINIPPGVKDGARLRLAGQGTAGQDGAPGDMYVLINIRPDRRFQRRGNDLYTILRVPWRQLLLGGEVHVPTPDNRQLALKIPAATDDGRIFRLSGQGMPILGGQGHGDLYAELHVSMPSQLSDAQRQLLEEWPE